MFKRPTHVVSYWHIPGGYNYSGAYIIEEPCFSQEEADAVAAFHGEDIPAMAQVYTLAEWYAARKRSIARRIAMRQVLV